MSEYKLASRENYVENTVIELNGCSIGGGNLVVIAGPCAVESEQMTFDLADLLSKMGVHILRGGVFKPRTSPYSFRGLRWEGLKILSEAGKSAGMPVITEVTEVAEVEKVSCYVDILQVGSRNMQNFGLLTEVGRSGCPVLLKRGFSATLEEWLLAAEYIMDAGNHQVILCERGIRTFEQYTRNTFDINAIPALKKMTHLPILADPSHGTGRRELVEAVSLAAVAAGADGVMVEVHPQPDKALSDGFQSLEPKDMAHLIQRAQLVHSAVQNGCIEQY